MPKTKTDQTRVSPLRLFILGSRTVGMKPRSIAIPSRMSAIPNATVTQGRREPMRFDTELQTAPMMPNTSTNPAVMAADTRSERPSEPCRSRSASAGADSRPR